MSIKFKINNINLDLGSLDTIDAASYNNMGILPISENK